MKYIHASRLALHAAMTALLVCGTACAAGSKSQPVSGKAEAKGQAQEPRLPVMDDLLVCRFREEIKAYSEDLERAVQHDDQSGLNRYLAPTATNPKDQVAMRLFSNLTPLYLKWLRHRPIIAGSAFKDEPSISYAQQLRNRSELTSQAMTAMEGGEEELARVLDAWLMDVKSMKAPDRAHSLMIDEATELVRVIKQEAASYLDAARGASERQLALRQYILDHQMTVKPETLKLGGKWDGLWFMNRDTVIAVRQFTSRPTFGYAAFGVCANKWMAIEAAANPGGPAPVSERPPTEVFDDFGTVTSPENMVVFRLRHWMISRIAKLLNEVGAVRDVADISEYKKVKSRDRLNGMVKILSLTLERTKVFRAGLPELMSDGKRELVNVRFNDRLRQAMIDEIDANQSEVLGEYDELMSLELASLEADLQFLQFLQANWDEWIDRSSRGSELLGSDLGRGLQARFKAAVAARDASVDRTQQMVAKHNRLVHLVNR